MTTTAAPYCMIVLALFLNSVSPSFNEMEFTMHLPCKLLSPSSMTSHLEESIITGTFEMSGSDARRRKKRPIISTPSMRPSSIQISMTLAPFSTCCLATLTASSSLSSFISFANLGEPATFVRSPIIKKFFSDV